LQYAADELLAQLFAQRALAGLFLEEPFAYTQMFLTHLDAEGNSSPAILIVNSTSGQSRGQHSEFVE